jgi:hypothetical protein
MGFSLSHTHFLEHLGYVTENSRREKNSNQDPVAQDHELLPHNVKYELDRGNPRAQNRDQRTAWLQRPDRPTPDE